MSSKRFGRVATLVALAASMALALAGCGSAGGPANDPAGSVTNALSAINGGGMAKIAEFACAAHKDDAANAFGASNASALEAVGLKTDEVLDAMSLSFSNVSAKEVSKTDTTAVVHVTADMKVSFDQEKFKALMKTVLAGQGQPTDEATLDNIMTMMSGRLEQTQHLDSDVTVVNEAGKWLLCE